MNRHAFELSLMTALALNCEIAPWTRWDRKQYYYPDLPKAYQISQYDLPFSSRGWLDIAADDPAQPRDEFGLRGLIWKKTQARTFTTKADAGRKVESI